VSLSPSSEITVEAWIKPSKTGKWFVGIVEKDGYYAGQTGYEFLIINDDGALRWEFYNPWRHVDIPAGSINFGSWNHVVGTYKSGEQKVYVNGVEKGSSVFTGEINIGNNGILGIGTRVSDTGSTDDRFFNGIIDEVRIWNKAIAPDDTVVMKQII